MSGKASRMLVRISFVVAIIFPSLGLSQTSPLKQFDGLKGKEREQRLSEGAKEGARRCL